MEKEHYKTAARPSADICIQPLIDGLKTQPMSDEYMSAIARSLVDPVNSLLDRMGVDMSIDARWINILNSENNPLGAIGHFYFRGLTPKFRDEDKYPEFTMTSTTRSCTPEEAAEVEAKGHSITTTPT